MSTEMLRFALIGERPLLMHSSRLADPLHPLTRELSRLTKKRDKTEADHEEIARLEWSGGMWVSEGKPSIPSEAIEAAFIVAARTRKKGPQAKAGFVCTQSPLLQYQGPTTIEELWNDPSFRLRVPVNVNMGSKTMRTRARFPDWRVDVTAEFVPGLLDPAEIIEILRVCGFRCGIGDWRPKFGRFSVELLE
jgi:hypothetical protein